MSQTQCQEGKAKTRKHMKVDCWGTGNLDWQIIAQEVSTQDSGHVNTDMNPLSTKATALVAIQSYLHDCLVLTWFTPNISPSITVLFLIPQTKFRNPLGLV